MFGPDSLSDVGYRRLNQRPLSTLSGLIALRYGDAMDGRLDMLKLALGNLAGSAEEQAKYLDELLGTNAAAYGNDELAQELNDAFASHLDMKERGLLADEQIAAIHPVDQMLGQLSAQADAAFWRREALETDLRWQQVRDAARAALRTL